MLDQYVDLARSISLAHMLRARYGNTCYQKRAKLK